MVPGFPRYQVSSLGRVKGPRKMLRPFIDRDGYHSVVLRRDLRSYFSRISRLVTLAWHGPCPSPRHTAAHNDGSKANDVPGNLRWATHEEQYADRIRHGTCNSGEKNAAARLKPDDVIALRKAYPNGIQVSEATVEAADYGVCVAHIRQIVNKTVWKKLTENLGEAAL